ncbi:MAG TPA: peptidoglycan-binding domain-containing protein [Mycobacteriales bacterium]|nr:peptidoglycan-binding domain-containing protein [Mycobacteriales bacterium]
MHHRIRRALGTLLAAGLLGSGVVALDVPAAQAAYPVPPTPAGLPAAIETYQPYIGQSTCDPVAKAGVSAFRNMLLRTYTDSGSFGIVRDCGAGGQSEHKEGRAFDWKVSAFNARQKAEATTLLAWLLKTDANGNTHAMARRLGVMYMIWNHKIWKAYDAAGGWKDYSGPNAHTDHVHFSFGWNGALKTTSYWDGTVAQVNFGPNGPPRITPVRAVGNIAIIRQYGGTTVGMHSSGAAVSLVQKTLKVSPVDGDFGSDTGTHVMRFQVDQKLPMTGRFGPAEWKRLFPFPVAPFGKVDAPGFALGNALVRGWALDADTQDPLEVSALVDGVLAQRLPAAVPRSDVERAYPEYGPAHGFSFVLPVPDGPHTICLTAHNAAQTPGTDTPLGCTTVDAQHDPLGGVSTLTSALGTVSFTGWALDPDSTELLTTRLTVNGDPSEVVLTPVTRTDIAARFPGMGDQHGVAAQLRLPEGEHTICLLADNVADTPGSDATVGCRTVQVQHSPVGAVDLLRRQPGGVGVRGWALDPDTAAAATVELLSDGVVVSSLAASRTRDDLPAVYAAQGDAHGFSTVLDLAVGTHSVCVRVLNATGTPGSRKDLACAPVVVSHDATGVVSALRTVPGGAVLATGDAYDADSISTSSVTVLVDGAPVRSTAAARPSAAAEVRWPGYGTARGFLATVTPTAGKHVVCVRAENVAGTTGAARTLACRTLVVHDATGGLTSLSRSYRTLTVRGWALDPDSRSATRASLLVDGRLVTSVTANARRSDMGTRAPGYGDYHGYTLVRTLSRGTHKVCVVGSNLKGTPGSGRYVGCRSVTIS